MPNSMTQILTNATSGESASQQWYGGEGQFSVSGTFGGSAAVELQMSPDDGTTWITVSGSSVTIADCKSFRLGTCDIRLAITNEHGTTSINGFITKTSGQWT